MRKLVFKGIINGKEFDNVQDYNAEMNRLLSSGETNISASSSTSVVDEPVDGQKINTKPEKPFDIHDYLPLFDDNANQYYLDRLVSDDIELNKKNLRVVEKELDYKIKSLNDILVSNGVSVEDAFAFINTIKEIRSNIKADSEGNDEAIEELEKRIHDDTVNLQVLKSATPVIDLVSSYYDNVFDLVKSYLFKF